MKGDVMKPYYSIEELASILDDDINNVADGLVACGIVPFCDGEPADLSQWPRQVQTADDGEIIILTGVYPVPNPSSVIVATENLPQSWKDYISGEEQKNLLTPTDNAAPPVFDKASPDYPEELDFALQAWRAVSATEEKGKPKTRIRAWLIDANANLPKEKKLSDEAINRITIIVNWDKRGGATRTD